MGPQVAPRGAGGRRGGGHGPEAGGDPAGRGLLIPDWRHRQDALGDRAGLPRHRRGMIFVDSNVPMYLVGADHPHKAAARRLLERAIVDDESLTTDVEVLQELLHRYLTIGRHDAIGPAPVATATSLRSYATIWSPGRQPAGPGSLFRLERISARRRPPRTSSPSAESP